MHDDRDKRNPDDPEPSLKDALLPKEPGRDTPPERSVPRDTYGETPSLKDALLPADHQPNPPTAPPTEHSRSEVTRHLRNTAPEKASPPTPTAEPSNVVIPLIVALAVLAGFVAVFFAGRASQSSPISAVPDTPSSDQSAEATAPEDSATPESAATIEPDWGDPGPMSLAAMQEQGLIIDVHEHIASLELAPQFIETMDALGIQKMCLMGTSKFTLTLNEDYGFTEYDENNEELIKIIDTYPGRFEAWPTIDPKDPEKLTKIQDLVARGATGVKLYLGHGYVTKEHEYMFHTVALDDPGMLPFYAWCEEKGIPLAFHVNPFGGKVGFAQEFIAVLTQYPDLKVIAPHFILSSVRSFRLEEFLDTFPNLYSDVSFGDYFMKERLGYISKHPAKFQRIFKKYPTRFMFASDLVMIPGRHADWAPTQLQAYIDMLSKETYTSAAIPGETLNGLALSDDLLSRVLFRNYLAFRAKQPKGTKITREINWDRMSQEPVDREPGQAFPPKITNK